jgi:hypothetical protein
MAGLINLRLLTDFFNKICQKRPLGGRAVGAYTWGVQMAHNVHQGPRWAGSKVSPMQ